MEAIYFTAAGIVLYLLSDRILKAVEQWLGRPLVNRTVVFFVIILTLSVAAFAALRFFTTPS